MNISSVYVWAGACSWYGIACAKGNGASRQSKSYRMKAISIIGHFQVLPGLCIKTRLGAQPLIWKWFFILMQIKLISTRKVVHLTSFWYRGPGELGNGLLTSVSCQALVTRSSSKFIPQPPKTGACFAGYNLRIEKVQFLQSLLSFHHMCHQALCGL